MEQQIYCPVGHVGLFLKTETRNYEPLVNSWLFINFEKKTVAIDYQKDSTQEELSESMFYCNTCLREYSWEEMEEVFKLKDSESKINSLSKQDILDIPGIQDIILKHISTGEEKDE